MVSFLCGGDILVLMIRSLWVGFVFGDFFFLFVVLHAGLHGGVDTWSFVLLIVVMLVVAGADFWWGLMVVFVAVVLLVLVVIFGGC